MEPVVCVPGESGFSACSGSRFDLDRALRSELFVSDGMLVTYHMAILLRRMGVAEVRTKR